MSARNAGPASLTLLPGSDQAAWPGLRDLAFLLGAEAAGLAGRLAPGTAAAMGDLVRGVNCYYSNLIEGHDDTRPIDIERALHADFETEPRRRDLQLEAVAHIQVQAMIDGGELDGIAKPSTLAVEIHRRFYERLPDALRWAEEIGTGRRVEVLPGRLREGAVRVGTHVAPAASELGEWMARLDEGAPERVGRSERLVAVAALHHRLLWVHPFADGNGRVARLLSHALLRRIGVGSPLWSVARGLARHVGAYRAHLARADDPPQWATDGRQGRAVAHRLPVGRGGAPVPAPVGAVGRRRGVNAGRGGGGGVATACRVVREGRGTCGGPPKVIRLGIGWSVGLWLGGSGAPGHPCAMAQGRIVSLFAGAGGLSRGFAEAGLLPALAAEIDEDAVSTYRANVSPEVLRTDIGTEADRVRAAAERRGLTDGVLAVVGGPPCQGFSTAGARDHSDPRNRLVWSYLDIVGRLRPSWFLFENVEGILTSGSGDAVVGLAERFTELGYSFRVEKVNFAAWGVPQARKRVLIVGNRHGVRFELPEPTHSYDGKKHRSLFARARPSITLGDAIVGLPTAVASSHRQPVPYASDVPASEYDALMRTAQPPGPKGHACANTERDQERIRLLKPGQSLRDLPEELWPASFRSRAFRRVADGMPTEKRGGAPAGLRRLDGTHASLTITSFSPRELVHPSLDRTLSLRECARLQGFPDGHDFHGGFQSVATQIGNAVPPIAAKVLAEWLQRVDGTAGGSTGTNAGTARPGLLGYHLTEASAMSPALAETDRRLRELVYSGGTTMAVPRRPRAKQGALLDGDYTRLGLEDRKAIADSRDLGPVSLSDRELARLVSVLLRDLGHPELIPRWARDIPAGDYYDVPLAWFTRDEGRPFDFGGLFLACQEAVGSFRVIFRCITKLHRHRRKFEVILRTQPLPTMEQIARRGLLEYGSMPPGVLASWLTWRKWAYDVDNRSAQETGYLFEPVLVESLGGRSVSAKASPVKRADNPAKGRQVDCILELGGKRYAYEFKDRITIAASGQGRFAEELSFPRDCQASGYVPVLMVMDPTPNPKLAQITRAFEEVGGRVFLGDGVWEHLAEVSGQEMATFVKRYVKDPVASIAVRERELLDLGMRYRSGPQGDTLEISIGTHTWTIPRPPRDEAVAVEGGDEPTDEPG